MGQVYEQQRKQPTTFPSMTKEEALVKFKDILPQLEDGTIVVNALMLTRYTDLAGIHLVVKRFPDNHHLPLVYIQPHIGPLLGLMKIKGVYRIWTTGPAECKEGRCENALDIINGHIGPGSLITVNTRFAFAGADNDINLCQEELIDAGLAEFAKL